MALALGTLLLLLPDVTPENRDEAIKAAFGHLDDAMWKMQAGGSPRREFTMAIAGWAYLIARDRPDEGRRLPSRRREIGRIHDELVRYVERVAKLYERDVKEGPMRTAQYTWPVSAAGLFFAECAARRKQRGASSKALELVAEILEKSQQKNGGWGHDDASKPGMGLPPIRIPKPGGGQLEYPGTLLCASHGALAALGASPRKSEAVRGAVSYFERAQNGDGTFPYDPSQTFARKGPSNGLAVARTPGAVYALLLAGVKKDAPVVEKALAAIDAQPEMMSEGHGSAALALLYGGLLADARGERAWRTFRTLFFGKILEKQEKDGAFLCIAEAKTFGVTVDTKELPGMADMPCAGAWTSQAKTYVTAIHTLLLMLDRTDSEIAPEAPAPKGAVTPREK